MASSSVATPYAPLHAYLKGRYADRVVLTFDQIEDLLGWTLPAEARVRADWWSNDGSDRLSPQAGVWIQASRRATANVFAHTVVFERVTDRDDRSASRSEP